MTGLLLLTCSLSKLLSNSKQFLLIWRDNTNQVKERRSREYYLKQFGFVDEIAKGLGLHLSSYGVRKSEWARFNELRDEGKDFDEIIRETGIRDIAAASDLERMRECLELHDQNKKRVWECLREKIEP